MTKQEKQLLLIDLCARLPYGVKIELHGEICTVFGIVDDYVQCTAGVPTDQQSMITNVKPYLRPMSSMTKEEREHLQTLHDIISDENYGDGFSPAAWEAILDFNNYCREHHLDNGGLITLGLALEAPEGMYK